MITDFGLLFDIKDDMQGILYGKKMPIKVNSRE